MPRLSLFRRSVSFKPATLKPSAMLCLALSIGVGVASAAFAQDSDTAKKENARKGDLQMMELEPELDSGKPEPAAPKVPRSVSVGAAPIEAKAVVVDVNSKNLTYDQARDVYVATGAVHVVISEQNSELFADQVIYDQNQSLLIAEGHVVIHKNGEKTAGTFAKIDLTRQSALINDITTKVEQVRIKAQQAMLANDYQVFENGRLIISQEMMMSAMDKKPKKGVTQQKQSTAKNVKSVEEKAKNQPKTVAKLPQKAPEYDPFSESSLSKLATTDSLSASTNDQRTIQPESVDLQAADDTDWDNDFLHIKAKEINMHRWKDGYTKIDVKKPSLYAGRFKVAGLSNAQFSSDPFTEETEYLGPDIGFDPDYGGFYYGPGYDFRLGNGSIRFSPMVSYGSAYRKRRGGNNRYENPGIGPGVGGIVHYRGDNTRIDLAYNSHVDQPVLYAERFLGDKKTRLIASVNEDYINGFMGFERPGFGVMVADSRQVAQFGKFRVDTFGSAGYFKDEFFPNNKAVDFVEFDTTQDPETAGRIQFQAQLANSEPLLSVGKWLQFGMKAQVAGAGYTTGDFIGIIRGGPTMTMNYKNRWRTSLRYFYSSVAGESPFLFDQYYYGRQQLGVTNQVKVNDYLTLGLQSQLSMNRDNAKDALFTGNQLFMLVGPKTVKLNLAYDMIRQRSYFGLMFMPGQKGKPIDYDTMRVYSPDEYQPPARSQ